MNLPLIYLGAWSLATTAPVWPGLLERDLSPPAEEEPLQLGPHGGFTFRNDSGSFELHMNSGTQTWELYALEPPARPLAQTFKLEIRSGGSVTEEITLHSVDPWAGLPHYQAPLRQHHSLGPANGSMKGIEFHFNP